MGFGFSENFEETKDHTVLQGPSRTCKEGHQTLLGKEVLKSENKTKKKKIHPLPKFLEAKPVIPKTIVRKISKISNKEPRYFSTVTFYTQIKISIVYETPNIFNYRH